MFWEKIASFFLIIFAVVGVVFLSIITHEYTHYNDFKNFSVEDERLCGFVLPTGDRLKNLTSFIWSPAGYYGFYLDTNNITTEKLAEYNTVRRQTEINAYTLGALIFVFYFICYLIVTFARYKDKVKILKYKWALEDREEYIDQLENHIKDRQ
jgi:hypothetical protein